MRSNEDETTSFQGFSPTRVGEKNGNEVEGETGACEPQALLAKMSPC